MKRPQLPKLVLGIFDRVFRDGFVHAGNIAYLSLTTLFPLFILFTAIAAMFGRTESGNAALAGFIETLPRDVAEILAPAISGVIASRASGIFTFGAIVALWTVTGFIETLRDVIRRPYDIGPLRAAWRSRLLSAVVAVGFVLIVLLSFFAQIFLNLIMEFVGSIIPIAADVASLIAVSRIIPAVVLFVALWGLFHLLTPRRFRHKVSSWPGALATAIVWVGAALLMPVVLGFTGGMAVTYGALAGVMVALLFFYVVGLGFVTGAELNAALAKRRDPTLGKEEESKGTS
jgi:membrane protein